MTATDYFYLLIKKNDPFYNNHLGYIVCVINYNESLEYTEDCINYLIIFLIKASVCINYSSFLAVSRRAERKSERGTWAMAVEAATIVWQ